MPSKQDLQRRGGMCPVQTGHSRQPAHLPHLRPQIRALAQVPPF